MSSENVLSVKLVGDSANLEQTLEKAGKGVAKFGDGVAMSGKQMDFALRGVPAQVTDIVTSLQAGQNPMTVFLQQGGQLKDMFGGVGPAAKALSGYVLGLVNPFTVAASAAGVLGLAYYQGSKEADAYAKALIMTGNAAGATVGQMQIMAKSIADAGNGTQHAAADALAQIAATGAVAAGNLQQFAAVAVKLQREAGIAVGDTAKQFAELGKEPLSASIKLNESMHYLTLSTYGQVKALEDQGRAAEAGALAQKTYADAMNQRAGQLKDNLGYIERGWRAVTGGAKDAWDAMLGVGRTKSPEEALNGVREEIARIQAGLQAAGRSITFDGPARARLKDLKEQEAYMSEAVRMGKRAAEQEALRNGYVEARVQFDKEAESRMGNQVKMQREIHKAEQEWLRLDPSQRTQKELDTRKADIIKKYTDTGAMRAALDKEIGLLEERQAAAKLIYAQEVKDLQASRSLKLQHERDYIDQSADMLTRQNRDNQAVVELEMEAVRKSRVTPKEKTELLIKYNKELALLKDEERLILRDKDRALWSYQEGEIEKLRKQAQDRLDAQVVAAEQMEDAARKHNDGLKDGLKLLDLERRLLGATSEQRQIAVEQLRIQLKLERDIEDVKRRGLQEGDQQEIVKRITNNAEREKQAAMIRAQLSAWEKLSDDINRLVSDGLMRGFENGKGFAENFRLTLENVFKTMILRPVVNAIVMPIGQSVASMVGGGAGGSGGVMGMYSTASNLHTIYGAGAQYVTGSSVGASGLSLGYANTVGAMGGDSMGALISANGGWAGVPVAGAGGTSAVTAGSVTAATETATLYGGTSAGASAAGGAAVVEGGSMAAAESAAMSMGPWGWVAAAVMIAWAYFSGRDKSYVASTGDSSIKFDEQGNILGKSDFSHASYAALLNERTDSFVTGMNAAYLSAAKSLGITAKASEFASGSNDSEGGKFNVGVNMDGNTIYNSGLVGQTQAAVKLAASQAVLAALASSELPKYLQGIFDDVEKTSIVFMSQDKVNALMTYAAQMKGLHDQFETMPFANLRDLSYSATQGLLGLNGGLEQFQNKLQTYHTNFYSQEEQREQAVKNIAKTLKDAGLEITAEKLASTTREQYRAMIEGIDVATESGRVLYTTMLNVSGAFAQITPAVAATASTLSKSAAALADEAKKSATTALDGLSRAIDAEKGGLNAQLASITTSVGKLQALASSLKGTLDGLRISGSDGAYRADAQAQISTALAIARAGGGLPLDGRLTSALATVSKPSEHLFSTFEDYARDFYRTANDIAALNDMASEQLTDQQRQQNVLEDQLKGLDAILANAKLQLDAANGINTSVLSVAQALAEFQAALMGVRSGGATTGQASLVGTESTPSILDTVAAYGQAHQDKPGEAYYFLSGYNDYAAKLSAWSRLAEISGQSVSDMVDGSGHNLAYWAEAQRQFDAGLAPTTQSVQGFASGGDFGGGLRLVGENGPELEVTGPSRIWSADQTRTMLQSGGADNAELLAELKLLREEVRGLRATADRGNENTQRAAECLSGRQSAPLLVEIAR